MAQNTMYVSKNNSPQTTLTNEITATEQTIPVADISKLPAAPNIASIGSGDNIELVYYAGISGSTLTGCVRGYHGTTASIWYEDTPVYRAYTSYDHDTFKSNIEDLATTKLDKTGNASSTTVTFTEAGTLANPATGESQATLWGKILKLFNQTSGHDHNGANSKKIAYTSILDTPQFEASASNIKADGTASIGSLNTIPRADHIHPITASNPNLVDNWDFRNPINQRGSSSYTGQGYTIDRWKISSTYGKLDIISGGIKFSITNASSTNILDQYYENISLLVGKKITMTIDVIAMAGSWMFQSGGGSNSLITNIGINTFTINSFIDFGNIIFRIYGHSVAVNDYISIRGVKVELGGTSTYENDPPMNYQLEWDKCRRYFQMFDGNANFFPGTADKIFIPTKRMRLNPTVTVSEWGALIYGVNVWKIPTGISLCRASQSGYEYTLSGNGIDTIGIVPTVWTEVSLSLSADL